MSAAAQPPQCFFRTRLTWGTGRSLLLVGITVLCCLTSLSASPIGLPLTRFYSRGEIGNIRKGAKLGVDHIGRLAVIHEGVYTVLNDQTWLQLIDKDYDGDTTTQISHSNHGSYYGAIGSWGKITVTPEGKFQAESLRPADCPDWALGTNFQYVLPVSSGAYFAGWSGAVYWDRASGTHTYFRSSSVVALFSVGDDTFISSRRDGILRLQLGPAGEAKVVTVLEASIEKATALDETHVLAATRDGKIIKFDGEMASPWGEQLFELFSNGILCIKRLADGDIAVAVQGKGVYILGADSEVRHSFDSEGYSAVRDLIGWEPGILWLATDLGVEELFYGSGVFVVDERVGIEIRWPQIARWGGKAIVCNHGELFEVIDRSGVTSASFRRIDNLPRGGAWGIAASPEHLLIGNAYGVFHRGDNGEFAPVLTDMAVDRLVMVAPDFVYVIGATAISAIKFQAGRWSECVERISGLGIPAITHAAKSSAWIELGANRVARIAHVEGRLHARVFDKFPWTESRWINVGVIDNIVVLSGPASGRTFFDEDTEEFCARPQLEAALNRSPYWIARVRKDVHGTIWASHENGVLRIFEENGTYRFDLDSLDIVRDRFPLVQIPQGRDVWLSVGYTLYHVDGEPKSLRPAAIAPILASVVNTRQIPLAVFDEDSPSLGTFDYTNNSLNLRFFSGTYSISSPAYEYRMKGGATSWTAVGGDSLLSLPNIPEGTYELEARVADNRGPVGNPLKLSFSIRPPWFRTMWAYALYGLAAVVVIHRTVSWSHARVKRRNALLGRLVRQRTDELRSTMEQLNEKSRNAAVLAERGRLAGEIHDSLQQGLSGLMLNLDATLKLRELTPEVRSRLATARNMVSFTRSEVQHAVWNLESPLLENADLGDALQKMAALINSGEARVDVEISGPQQSLLSAVQHHLLRIAQEAITNAVRHGQAERILVELVWTDGYITLAVSDNGRGFSTSEVMANNVGHFGLRGLRGRAAKLRGELQIHSTIGQGTRINIRVPLSPNAEKPGVAAEQMAS